MRTTVWAISFRPEADFDEAIANYQKALEIRPGHAEAHNNLGAALAARGRIRRGDRPSSEVARHQAGQRRGATTTWARPWPAADESTRRSPISRRPWKSKRTAPTLTITWASHWLAVDRPTRPVAQWQKALELATRQHKRALAESIRAKLQLQKAETPVRAAQQSPTDSAQCSHNSPSHSTFPISHICVYLRPSTLPERMISGFRRLCLSLTLTAAEWME